MPALPRSLVRSWAHYFASPWFQFLSGSLLTLSLPFWTAEISDTHNHYRTSICETVTCSFPIWASVWLTKEERGGVCPRPCITRRIHSHWGGSAQLSHTSASTKKMGRKKKKTEIILTHLKRGHGHCWSILESSMNPLHNQLHRQCKAFQERLGNHFTALASYPIPMDSFPRKRRNKNSNIINTGK